MINHTTDSLALQNAAQYELKLSPFKLGITNSEDLGIPSSCFYNGSIIFENVKIKCLFCKQIFWCKDLVDLYKHSFSYL